MDLSHALAGLGLGLSLIVAIGAQNVFVLRQGIRREHAFAVAAVCAISDLVLIVVGVSGIGAVLTAVPWLIDVVRWAGFAFLLGYGVLAARRAIRPSGEVLQVAEPVRVDALVVPGGRGARERSEDASRNARSADADRSRDASDSVGRSSTTRGAVLGTALALTWLNPHVYLDTVFLLGSVANSHGDGRWAFAAGAGVASILWFFGLAYGARWLGRWLATPRAWRILDAVIAVVMVAIAVSLVLPR
ncbi:LysE/ArgO family amino acid transporter [Agromyces sp. MMS24-JH15]|uniref:LysE/ArgO family amino acid transporter n=1 Tax=Agromyces sp. MMS24-JH15 TaxID=3243765 RepID=UPI003748ABC0